MLRVLLLVLDVLLVVDVEPEVEVLLLVLEVVGCTHVNGVVVPVDGVGVVSQ